MTTKSAINISKPKINTATAFCRESPLFWIDSTAGFKPMAKKSEIMIRTNTWLADASARIIVNAVIAPAAARNPK
ncbi:unannotated protein [freshwater metagenome]|uniref:Unannotated protein n=1 Tax=freshwater metagenome TaxID=449393 RepID=A0A6J7UF73_9ZZZZ